MERVAVFTAVEGMSLEASRATIQRLHALGVPVVPVTAMTLDEIAPLAAALELRHAMIIEAGGAIARWAGGGWEVEACGPSSEVLLDVIAEIEDRAGASLLVYSALPDREAARYGDVLRASARRCFSEPFIVENGDLESIRKAAAEIGFSIKRGRHFFHLCSECDQGEAFVRIREELGCDIAVAVGGTLLDADFLMRAEVPIIMPLPDGNPDPELLASVPQARVAPAPAPEGWSSAVLEACRTTARPVATASNERP